MKAFITNLKGDYIVKNTYVTSYFPLFTIIFFSFSLAFRTEMVLLDFLKKAGIYKGMLEFFSEGGIKLSLLILLLIMYFMVFAALKIIADTLNQCSLLFFSRDSEGESLKKIRNGTIIYLVGSAVSIIAMYSFVGIAIVFGLTTIAYFIYFLYQISSKLTTTGLIGIVFFQVLTWSTLLVGVYYLGVKVYNSIIGSLPI